MRVMDRLTKEEIEEELIEVGVSEIEIFSLPHSSDLRVLIRRKIHLAVREAVTKPWREVLRTDTE